MAMESCDKRGIRHWWHSSGTRPGGYRVWECKRCGKRTQRLVVVNDGEQPTKWKEA